MNVTQSGKKLGHTAGRAAFTLVEIMIGVAVIGVQAAIALRELHQVAQLRAGESLPEKSAGHGRGWTGCIL